MSEHGSSERDSDASGRSTHYSGSWPSLEDGPDYEEFFGMYLDDGLGWDGDRDLTTEEFQGTDVAATALGLRIDMVSGTVYYPVAGTGGEVGGQGEPGRPVGRLSVVGTYCDDVLLAAHDAELGTAPPIRMDLWGAAGGSVDEQVHVDFQAAAFRGAAIAQLGLAGWRFAPEPDSGCGDAATADDAGSRAADSAAAGGSGAGAADSVGLPKFPGEWAESAGEDSYSESWIGVCRLCFAHGYEAEADIDIDPRDVEDGCWMSKYWRGPNGRVYMGGQFSSGESPARPGGGGADQQLEAVRIAATWGPDVAATERWVALQKWAAEEGARRAAALEQRELLAAGGGPPGAAAAGGLGQGGGLVQGIVAGMQALLGGEPPAGPE